MFNPQPNPGSQPDQPAPSKLFEKLMTVSPEARVSLGKLFGALALEVFQRGGSISICSEGPEQGITVMFDGEVRRFNPLCPPDQEDLAIIRGHFRNQERGHAPSLPNNTLETLLEALRMWTVTEAQLRHRSL